MNIRDQYKQTEDKIIFFSNLTQAEKKSLYNELQYKEQSELLSILPFQYIKNFIFSYPKQEQQNIYKRLNQNQLKAIYNNLNADEKKEMMEVLEIRQIELATHLEESQRNIKNSKTTISSSEQTITNANENINKAKEELKTNKKELKENKIILKKIEKEREKQLKRVMKAKRKSSLTRIQNRISIISKYRTKKYLHRLEELEIINQNLNSQKEAVDKIKTNITNQREIIQSSKEQIKNEKITIQEEIEKINNNVSSMNRTEIKIKKLNKMEKNILGRKLYHQQVSNRDTILIRNKQPKNVTKTIEENNLPKENVTYLQNKQNIEQTSIQNKENVQTPEVEVIPSSRTNTQEKMEHVLNRANALNQMGVNFYPPVPINPIQNVSLSEEQITKLNQNQMIVMSYAMVAIWNYIYQQQLANQQNMNVQNDEEKHSLGRRGVVNLYLLLSVILFIFSLVLFFI